VKVERILVAIDDSPGSLSATEAAARLAALLDAELLGLFVEDDRLLRLAAAPLAREVDSLTAGPRCPGSAAVLRQLRLQGTRARESLRRVAERHRIAWSFRTARGAVSEEIAAAAAAAQIVSLGPGGWSTRPQRALGAAASAVLERRSACTLLLRRRVEVRPPVLVVYDGTEEAERAMTLGRQLTGEDAPSLEIILLGSDEASLRSVLGEGTEHRVVGSIAEGRTAELRSLLRRSDAGIVILPVGGEARHRETLHEVLADVDCPVLLVS
jgi:nucleotide-binding universal stress UspA family protein